jgi:hypothetical protein
MHKILCFSKDFFTTGGGMIGKTKQLAPFQHDLFFFALKAHFGVTKTRRFSHIPEAFENQGIEGLWGNELGF